MKRSWFGFFLLLVLLTGGILSASSMISLHKSVEADLIQAAELSLHGDWQQAGDLFRQARKDWEKQEKFRSCFADHNPVEQIDAEFAALTVLCAGKDTLSFAAGCSSLARQVAAVGEAHGLNWKNLL